MKITREELISICQDAVVPFREWADRDSYSAQLSIQSIYEGLCVGVDYKAKIDGETIWITFDKPTPEQHFEIGKGNHTLNIDSREDYFDEFGYEDEMFDGFGIDWNEDHLFTYMPTRKRLDEADGGDWY